MKTKYLMGTAVGGLMEMPEWRFDPPFSIIEADSVKDAACQYNKKHNCSFFFTGRRCAKLLPMDNASELISQQVERCVKIYLKT